MGKTFFKTISKQFQLINNFNPLVDRVTSTSPESVVIVMILFNLQCWRRLYECLYVNVDTGSKMNILHYIVGFVHYFCSGLGYLSEAPGFASLHSGQSAALKFPIFFDQKDNSKKSFLFMKKLDFSLGKVKKKFRKVTKSQTFP
jgi:hypothetical protein